MHTKGPDNIYIKIAYIKLWIEITVEHLQMKQPIFVDDGGTWIEMDGNKNSNRFCRT